MRLKVNVLLIFIVFLFSFSLKANDSITINLKVDNEFFQSILTPVWSKIPGLISIRDKSLGEITENVTGHLNYANISFGEMPKVLANVEIEKGKNNLMLNWNLETLDIVSKLELTFDYKKWGFSFSHKEIFNVDLSTIENAWTRLSFSLSEGRLKLDIKESQGFAFDLVEVRPANEASKFLKWVYKNLINKEKLNSYIKEELNKILGVTITEEKLLVEIENQINNSLNEIIDSKIRIDQIASHLNLAPKNIALVNNRLFLTSDVIFDQSELKVHSCMDSLASVVEERFPWIRNGNVQVNYEMIESLALNYLIYERYENKVLMQPELCFGYDKFDENGEALGEDISFKLLFRQLKAKIWVKPGGKTKFAYDINSNLITINGSFSLRLKGNGYPYVEHPVNRPLNLEMMAVLEPIVNENGGLKLKVRQVELVNISGDLFVKWFAITPFVRFPIENNQDLISEEVQKLLLEELPNGEIDVLKDGLKLWDGFEIGFKSYQINEQGHQFEIFVKE